MAGCLHSDYSHKTTKWKESKSTLCMSVGRRRREHCVVYLMGLFFITSHSVCYWKIDLQNFRFTVIWRTIIKSIRSLWCIKFAGCNWWAMLLSYCTSVCIVHRAYRYICTYTFVCGCVCVCVFTYFNFYYMNFIVFVVYSAANRGVGMNHRIFKYFLLFFFVSW